MPGVSNRWRRRAQLYEAPNSRWIAEFVGDINIIEGEVESRDAGRVTVATRDAGHDRWPPQPRAAADEDHVCVAIRPEKVRLSRRGPASDAVHAHADQPAGRRRSPTSAISAVMTSYRSGSTAGALLRASMANTRAARRRRLRRERSAWWRGSRRTIAWCWSNERAPHLRASGALARRSRLICGCCCSSWCRSASC